MDEAHDDGPSLTPAVRATLRAAPVTIPCAAALCLVAWWAGDGGGFSVSRWAPGGLVLTGLLIVALVAIPNRWGAVPGTVRLSAGALSAYAAWSLASVAWADDPGAAWEGGSRTLLYAIVFCLFALWPQERRTATALLGAWVGAIGLVAAVIALRLGLQDDPSREFRALRLASPTGYYNATASLFLMPLLPAVCLAAGARAPWVIRGAFAGVAVLLGALGLLCVSRGAAITLPLAAVAMFAVVPLRARLGLVALPVVIALAALGPGLLGVGDALKDGTGAPELARAMAATAVAAVLTAVVVALGARALERHPASAATRVRLVHGGRLVGALAAVCLVVGGLVVAGNPFDRVDAAWTSFKGGYGDNDVEANRLVGGLGSNRYDFYRVSLRVAGDHPIAGIGADGFFEPYLRDGRSSETPRYPHSWELRALSQTGVIGVVLLLVGLGAALVACLRGMRTVPGAAAAAGGGLLACVTWLAHGSVDWFWEWAGLGAPAFALLGLGCALAPRAGGADAQTRKLPLPVALVALVLAVPFASLWLGAAEQRAAARSFGAGDAKQAYRQLDRAARLDPFSARPARLEGSIALREGDLVRADAAFGDALARSPKDQYATLERGAAASARGDRSRALRLLRRAAALAPRDQLTREALAVVRAGRALDTEELNRRILTSAQSLDDGG